MSDDEAMARNPSRIHCTAAPAMTPSPPVRRSPARPIPVARRSSTAAHWLTGRRGRPCSAAGRRRSRTCSSPGLDGNRPGRRSQPADRPRCPRSGSAPRTISGRSRHRPRSSSGRPAGPPAGPPSARAAGGPTRVHGCRRGLSGSRSIRRSRGPTRWSVARGERNLRSQMRARRRRRASEGRAPRRGYGGPSGRRSRHRSAVPCATGPAAHGRRVAAPRRSRP